MAKFETKKYDAIIKELVADSFPILKDKKIKIKKVLFPRFYKYSAYAFMDDGLFWLFRKKFYILVNPKYMKRYNDFEIKGVFAHELCHLEDFARNSRWWFFLNNLKYTFENYRERYEKEADKKAICKGYRKELKSFREKRWSIKDKNLEKMKGFYLTPKEIDKVIC